MRRRDEKDFGALMLLLALLVLAFARYILDSSEVGFAFAFLTAMIGVGLLAGSRFFIGPGFALLGVAVFIATIVS